MRHRIVCLAAVLAFVLGMATPDPGIAQKAGKAKPAAQAPPAAGQIRLPVTLDELYPPRAQEPVFLLKMHAMNMALTGMVVDLMEKDLANARTNYEQFRKEYTEASRLVPEWTAKFTREPVDQLRAVLASADQEKVMQGIGKVGQVCHNCHVSAMTLVQQKYHWPDFRNVSVTDPIMNTHGDFAEFMQMLNFSFTGIAVDLRQGQTEGARKHFDAFRARFQTLKETCIACHDSERKYFVDPMVTSTIDGLGAELVAATIDPAKVQKLSMQIGEEACFECHLVHIPAALAKQRLAPSAMSSLR